MSTTSITARFLSIAVLILSLAPLGSMYFLLTSWGIDPTIDHPIAMYMSQRGSSFASFDSAEFDATMKLFFNAMQSPNATTLEQLWTAVFLPPRGAVVDAGGGNNNGLYYHQNHGSIKNPAAAAAARMMSPLFMAQQLRYNEWTVMHLKTVLPWFVSFFLGFIVPTGLSIWSLIRQHRQKSERRRRREHRVKTTKHILKCFVKQLQPQDQILQENDHEPQPSSDKNDETTQLEMLSAQNSHDTAPMWNVPLPGVPITTNGGAAAVKNRNKDGTTTCFDASTLTPTRSVVDQCAICLNNYQIGDWIVWSPNPCCVHCFHEDCIKAWLLRNSHFAKDKEFNLQLCPCCRQPFVTNTNKKT